MSADLEFRAGRIICRGNYNAKARVFRYVTENTSETYLWQTIETKQKFKHFMTSKTPVRVVKESFAWAGEEQIDLLRMMKDEIERSDFSDLVYTKEDQLPQAI